MILKLAIGLFTVAGLCWAVATVSAFPAQIAMPKGANLAVVAKSTTSYVSGHETITALNDGFDPANSNDKSHGAYGNWPRTGTQWVQYEWDRPVSLNAAAVYWFDDNNGVRLPIACRLLFWDGSAFVPVAGAGVGLALNRYNVANFPEINTTRIRLEFDGQKTFSTGLLEWRVYDSGKSPNFAPTTHAGGDRAVIVGVRTYLDGKALDDGKPRGRLALHWGKASGPGDVTFGQADIASTWATFSRPGHYRLAFTADDGELRAADHLEVLVGPRPPAQAQSDVSVQGYRVTSAFWKSRMKSVIVNWIPHCIQKIEDPRTEEGGIDNFVQARRKLEGMRATHKGAPFSNAWVYNTMESICLALMVDSQGDPEIESEQAMLRRTMDSWIPILLGAQEKDGYLHTATTINSLPRWTNKYDHEGYQSGYFIEACIAHFQLTGGHDRRMYDAAKRLADCWDRNIGPSPKRRWYDGHQELEQALIRLADLVERVEGTGAGKRYVALSQFLLDSRGGGDEYDQSHIAVTRQYEAVGHAVRAVYSYNGMAGVASHTGNIEYQSAILSLWDSIVNRKYYVTGGVGSGETSEGFGKDYSLPSYAYCESCSGCGELFFQHSMGLIYRQAKYADLMEETLYNAVLGGLDLDGKNFTYTNALDSSGGRYLWHVCPCCVGNIPRTLLRLPEWIYATEPDGVTVNLYVGSTIEVGRVAGMDLSIEQTTDYPWKGSVRIVVHPKSANRFTVRLRLPDRETSALYTPAPKVAGLESVEVNGKAVKAKIVDGYAEITRIWLPGDKIDLSLPMQPQRIHASEKIAATRGRVALRYGPLLYNFESVDQPVDAALDPSAPLTSEFRSDLLGGVVVLKGQSTTGTPMIAIPNYARLNRGGRSVVWVKE